MRFFFAAVKVLICDSNCSSNSLRYAAMNFHSASTSVAMVIPATTGNTVSMSLARKLENHCMGDVTVA